MDINEEIDFALLLLGLAIKLEDKYWVAELKEWLAELVDTRGFTEDQNT